MIVSNLYNPQSLNRYSYAYNNPVNFTDPTGHTPICLDDWCNSLPPVSSGGMSGAGSFANTFNGKGAGSETLDSPTEALKKEIGEKFGVAFDTEDKWTEKELKIVWKALLAIAKTLRSYTTISNDPFVIFRMVFNSGWPNRPILFDKVDYKCAEGCWGRTVSSHEIRWYSDANLTVGLVVHEMGHAFNAVMGGDPYERWNKLSVGGKPSDKSGFRYGLYWSYFSAYTDTGEQFADNFVGLVLGTFSGDQEGRVRNDFMNSNMPAWVAMGLFGP